MQMENRDGTEGTSTGLQRKKRNVADKHNAKMCPKDFEKVSEEMCLHYSEIESTFEASNAYCPNKAEDAKLFSFTDSAEAESVWKWLGNHYYVCNISMDV